MHFEQGIIIGWLTCIGFLFALSFLNEKIQANRKAGRRAKK